MYRYNRLPDAPIVVAGTNVWSQTLYALLRVSLDFSVAQECESVLMAIFDIVILESRILNGLEEVDGLWCDILAVSRKRRQGMTSTYRARP